MKSVSHNPTDPALNVRKHHPIVAIMQAKLVETVGISIVLSLGLTGGSAFNIWQIYRGLQTSVSQQLTQQELSDKVVYLDEVLTMSAYMAASTSDPKWEKRYNEYVPQLESAIESLLKDVPQAERVDSEQTDAANKKLVELETKAFDLIRQGKAPEAVALLNGGEYIRQKEIYGKGINGTLVNIKKSSDLHLNIYRQNLSNSLAFAAASILLLMLTWSIVLVAVRSYILDRKLSQASLESSQAELATLNENLQAEVTERSKQEERIRQESDLLQNDIEHILDIVCEIEAGNLSTQAQVNDRTTGLIADTLNRLIESLQSTIGTVVDTTKQVGERAISLESAATTVASSTDSQFTAVNDIQNAIAETNRLVALSTEKMLAATNTVDNAQIAIAGGREEMLAMVNGIDTLQDGTERMLQRSQLLNEFTQIIGQFSKDRQRLSALTRVLALNASTLANRALKERDSEQFTTIAREFEAIAWQVNELADASQKSLGELQQNNEKIQTVTSGFDRDLNDVSVLVKEFTDEVERARQAFTKIEIATAAVANLNREVSDSSQDIRVATERTESAIQAIATLARNTSERANSTRNEVQTLKNSSQELLDKVAFFRMNKDLSKAELN
jgi:methyl-accepting chemotaxis protein PixJ